MKKFNQILTVISLIAGIAINALMFFIFYLFSENYAFYNPEIAYMQYPMLGLVYLMLSGFLAALVIALILVLKSRGESIFKQKTVRALRWMGHAFLFSFFSCLAIYLYSYSQLASGMGLIGAYIILALAMCFVAMNVIYFLANLFERAVFYKEESDLLV